MKAQASGPVWQNNAPDKQLVLLANYRAPNPLLQKPPTMPGQKIPVSAPVLALTTVQKFVVEYCLNAS